jgi:nitrile hydratase alpha subunit
MSEHTHDHGHDHGHPHPNQPDIDSEPMGYYQVMGSALGELLIEKGVITADELRAAIETVDSRTPEGGAKVVAKAWTDPDYKSRLLENGTAAVDELGIDMPATHLVVVENTETVHNVIVCTLCSCYPRMLLGLPPDWYKAHAYRSRVVREPRAVLKEFGTELPDDVEIRVHDSTADMRYLVLPRRPEGTEGMSEEELVGVVSRDSMIGVTLPKVS